MALQVGKQICFDTGHIKYIDILAPYYYQETTSLLLLSTDIAVGRAKKYSDKLCVSICVANLLDLRLVILPQFRMGLDTAGSILRASWIGTFVCQFSSHSWSG